MKNIKQSQNIAQAIYEGVVWVYEYGVGVDISSWYFHQQEIAKNNNQAFFEVNPALLILNKIRFYPLKVFTRSILMANGTFELSKVYSMFLWTLILLLTPRFNAVSFTSTSFSRVLSNCILTLP